MDLGETRSTTNLNSACSICSSLHPKGTATSCYEKLGGDSSISLFLSIVSAFDSGFLILLPG